MATVGSLGVTLFNDPKAYKVMYTSMKQAVEWTTPEFTWYDELPELDIVISGNAMYMPVDVQQGFGAAAIADGGREALPVSPVIQYATLNLTAWNARVSITRQSKFGASQNQAAMVTNEAKYKFRKRLEAIAHKGSLNFYGFTVGQVAQASAAVSGSTSGTLLTLTNVFGDTGLTNTSYINQLINVGDQIAMLSDGTSSGTLLAGGVGLVTGKTAGNVFSVSFSAALTITSSAAVTFANNAAYGDTFTAAAHTDQNNWQPGMKDMTESTTSYGLSGTTNPGWSASVLSSTAGRFVPTKLINIRQTMAHFGKPLKKLIIAEGVQRDMADQVNASVRFDGIAAAQFDGSSKTKEEQVTSRYVPNGHVFGLADGVLMRKVLGDSPTAGEGEWDKLENYARYVNGEDYMCVVGCASRKGLAEYRGQTES